MERWMRRAREIWKPPLTRGDCIDGMRPCPWLECRWNLGPRGDYGCVLDVADRGGSTLQEVADCLAVTRERIRQIELKALRKLSVRHSAFLLEWGPTPTLVQLGGRPAPQMGSGRRR